MTRRDKTAILAILAIYLLLVFQFTVLSRPLAVQQIKTSLFWCYRRFFAGKIGLGAEIAGNILMFVPVGLLFSSCFRTGKRRALWVLLLGLLCSCAIEFFQMRLMRGWMEYDDILSNTLGAILGYGACCAAEGIIPVDRRRFAAVVAIGVFCVAGASLVCQLWGSNAQDDTLRTVCVQIDSISRQEDTLTLTGFAFRFGQNNRRIALELRSTATGRTIPVTTQDCLERQDVNAYFAGSIDLTRSGFRAVAEGVNPGEEYEVLVHYDWPLVVPAGLYLLDDEIRYIPSAAGPVPELEGTDAAFLTGEGVLLVSRPDQDCWVWQYSGALYWVVGPSFPLLEGGSTPLECQCYTSQPERLPEERRQHGWTWENFTFSFEANEITEGDFGLYRISRQELPADYALKAVLIGSYQNDNWVWQQWFRPTYHLPAEE